MKSLKCALLLPPIRGLRAASALRLIRELYTFDLMQFASGSSRSQPTRKRVADELLVARLASITLLERVALSRCPSAMGGLRSSAGTRNHGFGRLRWKIHAFPNLALSGHCCARQRHTLSSKPSAITRSGRCVPRFAWRCYETNSRRSLAPSNSRAACRLRNCVTFCMLRVCRRRLRVICGKLECEINVRSFLLIISAQRSPRLCSVNSAIKSFSNTPRSAMSGTACSTQPRKP